MAGFSGHCASSHSDGTLTGVARIKGPKWAQMPLVTICMLGIQIVWSVEMGYASPYLLSLGLSKSLMSIVFLAGPLSGLVVQPLVGVLADQSKSRFGRRRPYIWGGISITLVAIILLGFTRTFSNIFTASGSKANDYLTIALAVFAIYCIDFAINAVQASDRALLVDLLPHTEQDQGNAWASRMHGVGSIAGFFIGNIDLPKVLPIFGRTELEILSVITCITLVLSHGITSVSITEKVLVQSTDQKKSGVFSIFRDIWINMRTLPWTVKQICIIQFFAWIGWFPMLFFSTVYVGQIYMRDKLASDPTLKNDQALQDEATRAGSRALLEAAVLMFTGSILLPYVTVQSNLTYEPPKSGKSGLLQRFGEWFHPWKIHTSTLWAASQLLFSVLMLMTYFVSTTHSATLVIALTGCCSAVSAWVPFSLLGEAIALESSNVHDKSFIPLRSQSRSPSSGDGEDQLMFTADGEFGQTDEESKMEQAHNRTRSLGSIPHASVSRVNLNVALESSDPSKSVSSADEDETDEHYGGKEEEDGLLRHDLSMGDEESAGSGRIGGEATNRSGILLVSLIALQSNVSVCV
ncbi:hypothetical protein FRC03_008241 [Tulasnella sp. 419]|nr:hypothetical protein FRC03_008241 [Tulasnella sp. 419]